MAAAATIRFWGVRGSIAAPGGQTTRTGGNTSCVELRLGDERIIIDGGTGLRQLGLAQGSIPLRATILFSHLHWDHIQGVPFCGPLFHPESELRLVGPRGLREALIKQMSGPTFPIGIEMLNATLTFEEIEAGEQLSIGPLVVRTARLNHPGGGIGYRIEDERGLAVVHAVDHEHGDDEIDAGLVKLAEGAHALIYDAQYLPAEYPAKVGWGHSCYDRGAELAAAAGVRSLLLTHHDPTRDDDQIDAIERGAQELFPETTAAREGRFFVIERRRRRSKAVAAVELHGESL